MVGSLVRATTTQDGVTTTGDEYGVRVTNPLSLPVRVELLLGGIVVGSMLVQPMATLYLPMERGDYEVRTTIISVDANGVQEERGEGSWSQTKHEDVAGQVKAEKPKEKAEEKPLRSLGDMIEEMRKREEVSEK